MGMLSAGIRTFSISYFPMLMPSERIMFGKSCSLDLLMKRANGTRRMIEIYEAN